MCQIRNSANSYNIYLKRNKKEGKSTVIHEKSGIGRHSNLVVLLRGIGKMGRGVGGQGSSAQMNIVLPSR
jgi:hypothetical protein